MEARTVPTTIHTQAAVGVTESPIRRRPRHEETTAADLEKFGKPEISTETYRRTQSRTLHRFPKEILRRWHSPRDCVRDENSQDNRLSLGFCCASGSRRLVSPRRFRRSAFRPRWAQATGAIRGP